MNLSERTRTVLIGVVTAVWVANFAAGLWVKGYEPSEAVNGIFLLVVGSLFATRSKEES